MESNWFEPKSTGLIKSPYDTARNCLIAATLAGAMTVSPSIHGHEIQNIQSVPSQAGWPQGPTYISSVKRSKVATTESNERNVNYPELSLNLMHEFGFNISSWAKVLKVERKTLYNWKNRPDTNIQKAILIRLDQLKIFSLEMDEGHKKYLSLFSFGKRSDSELLVALTSKSIAADKLINNYDRLYNAIHGLEVRAKMA